MTFPGRYYRLADARCEPRPVQRPRPPIVIGGTGERRTAAVVARWADHWNLGFARYIHAVSGGGDMTGFRLVSDDRAVAEHLRPLPRRGSGPGLGQLMTSRIGRVAWRPCV